MNESFIFGLDWECPDKPGTAKTWTLKLPEGPGLYRVYVYAGQHRPWPGGLATQGPAKHQSFARGAVHGCSVENIRLGEDWQRAIKWGYGSHGVIEKIVRTYDDLLTFRGGRYCQAINWILVERLYKRDSDRPLPAMLSQFDPVFLPSSTTDNGVLWEAQTSEIDASSSESIGFVSFHYPGVKSPAGKEIGYGIGRADRVGCLMGTGAKRSRQSTQALGSRQMLHMQFQWANLRWKI